MPENIKMSLALNASPDVLFNAWLDSKAHTEFTGSTAEVDPSAGGKFTAWDGYIYGTTLEIEFPRRIVQAWSTTEFPEGAAPSRLELLIEPADGGCQLTLNHTNIPDGQGDDYRQGWLDYYFEPMKEYFDTIS